MTGRSPRIAIIGAGPAGFYAAQALVVADERAEVTVVERLPVPHGLVRHGVAPDHWTVRSKGEWFDRILAHPRVRLRANVTIGRDLTVDDVAAHHDAVILAVGADRSRMLGVPGEQLRGSLPASDYVGWYNAHPDHAALDPPLDTTAAAVVGMGNVALDVVRSLALPTDRLHRTDMAAHAVAALHRSPVRHVHVLGRRGPSQTRFTPKELREVAELDDVQLVVDPAALAADRPPSDDTAPAGIARAARVVELLSEFATDAPGAARMHVHLHFGVSPVRVLGDNRVRGVVLAHNRLVGDRGGWRAEQTPDRSQLDVGLLLRSIGYRSRPVPDLPFDDAGGVIPTRAGRVVDANGTVLPGRYATGWVRRGPTGVIGTNKRDAEEVVAHLLSDLPHLPCPEIMDAAAFDELLAERGIEVVDAQGWDRIRRSERRAGSRLGRPAQRLADVAEQIAAARAPAAARAA